MNDAEVELRQLCDKYRKFPPEERHRDRRWLLAGLEEGELNGTPVKTFLGKIIAVYREEVALVGDDETAMRVQLSKRYKVHPGRFVLLVVDEDSLPKKAAAAGCSIVTVVVVLLLCAVLGIAAISALGSKANNTFSKIGSNVE